MFWRWVAEHQSQTQEVVALGAVMQLAGRRQSQMFVASRLFLVGLLPAAPFALEAMPLPHQNQTWMAGQEG
jgi:hypothetical protein